MRKREIREKNVEKGNKNSSGRGESLKNEREKIHTRRTRNLKKTGTTSGQRKKKEQKLKKAENERREMDSFRSVSPHTQDSGSTENEWESVGGLSTPNGSAHLHPVQTPPELDLSNDFYALPPASFHSPPAAPFPSTTSNFSGNSLLGPSSTITSSCGVRSLLGNERFPQKSESRAMVANYPKPFKHLVLREEIEPVSMVEIRERLRIFETNEPRRAVEKIFELLLNNRHEMYRRGSGDSNGAELVVKKQSVSEGENEVQTVIRDKGELKLLFFEVFEKLNENPSAQLAILDRMCQLISASDDNLVLCERENLFERLLAAIFGGGKTTGGRERYRGQVYVDEVRKWNLDSMSASVKERLLRFLVVLGSYSFSRQAFPLLFKPLYRWRTAIRAERYRGLLAIDTMRSILVANVLHPRPKHYFHMGSLQNGAGFLASRSECRQKRVYSLPFFPTKGLTFAIWLRPLQRYRDSASQQSIPQQESQSLKRLGSEHTICSVDSFEDAIQQEIDGSLHHEESSANGHTNNANLMALLSIRNSADGAGLELLLETSHLFEVDSDSRAFAQQALIVKSFRKDGKCLTERFPLPQTPRTTSTTSDWRWLCVTWDPPGLLFAAKCKIYLDHALIHTTTSLEFPSSPNMHFTRRRRSKTALVSSSSASSTSSTPTHPSPSGAESTGLLARSASSSSATRASTGSTSRQQHPTHGDIEQHDQVSIFCSIGAAVDWPAWKASFEQPPLSLSFKGQLARALLLAESLSQEDTYKLHDLHTRREPIPPIKLGTSQVGTTEQQKPAGDFSTQLQQNEDAKMLLEDYLDQLKNDNHLSSTLMGSVPHDMYRGSFGGVQLSWDHLRSVALKRQAWRTASAAWTHLPRHLCSKVLFAWDAQHALLQDGELVCFDSGTHGVQGVFAGQNLKNLGKKIQKDVHLVQRQCLNDQLSSAGGIEKFLPTLLDCIHKHSGRSKCTKDSDCSVTSAMMARVVALLGDCISFEFCLGAQNASPGLKFWLLRKGEEILTLIRSVLARCCPNALTIELIMAVASLADAFASVSGIRKSTSTSSFLSVESGGQGFRKDSPFLELAVSSTKLLFDLSIWSSAPAIVQASLFQVLQLHLRSRFSFIREFIGVQRLLDLLRLYYYPGFEPFRTNTVSSDPPTRRACNPPLSLQDIAKCRRAVLALVDTIICGDQPHTRLSPYLLNPFDQENQPSFPTPPSTAIHAHSRAPQGPHAFEDVKHILAFCQAQRANPEELQDVLQYLVSLLSRAKGSALPGLLEFLQKQGNLLPLWQLLSAEGNSTVRALTVRLIHIYTLRTENSLNPRPLEPSATLQPVDGVFSLEAEHATFLGMLLTRGGPIDVAVVDALLDFVVGNDLDLNGEPLVDKHLRITFPLILRTLFECICEPAVSKEVQLHFLHRLSAILEPADASDGLHNRHMFTRVKAWQFWLAKIAIHAPDTALRDASLNVFGAALFHRMVGFGGVVAPVEHTGWGPANAPDSPAAHSSWMPTFSSKTVSSHTANSITTTACSTGTASSTHATHSLPRPHVDSSNDTSPSESSSAIIYSDKDRDRELALAFSFVDLLLAESEITADDVEALRVQLLERLLLRAIQLVRLGDADEAQAVKVLQHNKRQLMNLAAFAVNEAWRPVRSLGPTCLAVKSESGIAQLPFQSEDHDETQDNEDGVLALTVLFLSLAVKRFSSASSTISLIGPPGATEIQVDCQDLLEKRRRWYMSDAESEQHLTQWGKVLDEEMEAVACAKICKAKAHQDIHALLSLASKYDQLAPSVELQSSKASSLRKSSPGIKFKVEESLKLSQSHREKADQIEQDCSKELDEKKEDMGKDGIERQPGLERGDGTASLLNKQYPVRFGPNPFFGNPWQLVDVVLERLKGIFESYDKSASSQRVREEHVLRCVHLLRHILLDHGLLLACFFQPSSSEFTPIRTTPRHARRPSLDSPRDTIDSQSPLSSFKLVGDSPSMRPSSSSSSGDLKNTIFGSPFLMAMEPSPKQGLSNMPSLSLPSNAMLHPTSPPRASIHEALTPKRKSSDILRQRQPSTSSEAFVLVDEPETPLSRRDTERLLLLGIVLSEWISNYWRAMGSTTREAIVDLVSAVCLEVATSDLQLEQGLIELIECDWLERIEEEGEETSKSERLFPLRWIQDSLSNQVAVREYRECVLAKACGVLERQVRANAVARDSSTSNHQRIQLANRLSVVCHSLGINQYEEEARKSTLLRILHDQDTESFRKWKLLLRGIALCPIQDFSCLDAKTTRATQLASVWKLDRRESQLRMRLRLKRAFGQYAANANVRETLIEESPTPGSLTNSPVVAPALPPNMQLEEMMNLTKTLAEYSASKERQRSISAEDEPHREHREDRGGERRGTFVSSADWDVVELTSVHYAARNEQVVHSTECELVLPMCVVRGRMDLTSSHIYFYGDFVAPPGQTTDERFLGEPSRRSSLRRRLSRQSSGQKDIGCTTTEMKNDIPPDMLPLAEWWKDHSDASESKLRPRRWALKDLCDIQSRRYLLRRSAMELFFVNRKNYLLNFLSVGENKTVFERILQQNPPLFVRQSGLSGVLSGSSPSMPGMAGGAKLAAVNKPSAFLKTLQADKLIQSRQEEWTTKWVNWEMSTFEYLMHLNTAAGRTCNDLTQYPVFPWVLADYESEQLDLSDPAVYRDLSKPIGALNAERLHRFRQRKAAYESCRGARDEPAFLYGSHYSTVGTVLFFLIRVEPFATYAKEMQGGRFDHADRLFHSVQEAWNHCLTSDSDLKELIPEWFYLNDLYLNRNKLSLGERQDGTSLGDVILPPWAGGSPEKFVQVNREALEGELVSANIHQWIDLVFGYKQRGLEAEKADNLFYYLTYEDAVDVDSITDPVLKSSVEAQIANFGQTPAQLFSRAHPKRKPMPARFMNRPCALLQARGKPHTLSSVPGMQETKVLFGAGGFPAAERLRGFMELHAANQNLGYAGSGSNVVEFPGEAESKSPTSPNSPKRKVISSELFENMLAHATNGAAAVAAKVSEVSRQAQQQEDGEVVGASISGNNRVGSLMKFSTSLTSSLSPESTNVKKLDSFSLLVNGRLHRMVVRKTASSDSLDIVPSSESRPVRLEWTWPQLTPRQIFQFFMRTLPGVLPSPRSSSPSSSSKEEPSKQNGGDSQWGWVDLLLRGSQTVALANGTALAGGGYMDSCVRVHSALDGSLLQSVRLHSGSGVVTCLSTDEACTFLACGCLDGSVVVWELTAAKEAEESIVNLAESSSSKSDFDRDSAFGEGAEDSSLLDEDLGGSGTDSGAEEDTVLSERVEQKHREKSMTAMLFNKFLSPFRAKKREQVPVVQDSRGPTHLFAGFHSHPITAVFLNRNLDVVGSCSFLDDYISIHTLSDGRFLRAIALPEASSLPGSVKSRCVMSITSSKDGLMLCQEVQGEREGLEIFWKLHAIHLNGRLLGTIDLTCPAVHMHVFREGKHFLLVTRSSACIYKLDGMVRVSVLEQQSLSEGKGELCSAQVSEDELTVAVVHQDGGLSWYCLGDFFHM